MDLKKEFIELVGNYSKNNLIIDSYWQEIEKKYTSKKRYYHTLAHLEVLIDQLNDVKDLIADWDTLIFSVFYHDIIYNVLRSDNEEESAELAAKRLSELNYPTDKIKICNEHIRCTKNHLLHHNPDTNLFTDADLSILGQSTDIYKQYCEQVRKEYSIYPDIVYKPGRKKGIDSLSKHGSDLQN